MVRRLVVGLASPSGINTDGSIGLVNGFRATKFMVAGSKN